MQYAATTQATGPAGQAQALPGLIAAFRFRPDGSVQELPVDQPIADAEGWLWLHFNLADARACPFLRTLSGLRVPARELLVSPEEHQQLHRRHLRVWRVRRSRLRARRRGDR